MCKKAIYLIFLFLLVGLLTGVANAVDAFMQSSGADGLVSMNAIHYDVNNSPEYEYIRPPDYNDPNIYIHHWDPVVLEFDLRSDPNATEPNKITGPSLQCLPDVGLWFKPSPQDANFINDAPRLDFNVKFVKTGTHYVWVRSYTNGTVGWGVSNSFYVSMDNEETLTETMEIDKRIVYGWEDEWQRDIGSDPAIFDIIAGLHTINIYAREDGLLIEKIVITTNPNYDPNEIDDGNGPPESPRVDLATATGPTPSDEEQNVFTEVVLSWFEGDYATGHDVYFGTTFEDVNDASRDDQTGILYYSQNQSQTYYPTSGKLSLDYGQTYYWRIDEVNTPDDEIWKGEVWEFTVEPLAWPLASSHVVGATASSSEPNQGPEKTKDGSGLNANDKHSTTPTDMWLTTAGAPATIEYQFDRLYKLHSMKVWNYNETLHTDYGLNQVVIQYSKDGITYNTLGVTHTLNEATGAPDYAANTEIDFQDKVAKYVRITANTNHGGVGHCGLSEVRFYYIPLRARVPVPGDGTPSINPNTVVLEWRPGREAAEHKVYISEDQDAVEDGSAYITTVYPPNTSYDAGSLQSLELGKTYYWKITEVNSAEAPDDTWEGDVWDFDTRDSFVVDNMERYGDRQQDDIPGMRIYYVWKHGWTTAAMAGNNTGSQVYHWDNSGTGLMESTIVRNGVSMPYFYENDGSIKAIKYKVPYEPTVESGSAYTRQKYSEASASISDLPVGPDWAPAKVLSLWFFGDLDNTAGVNDRMYVALEDSSANVAVVKYDAAHDYDPEDVKEYQWYEWNLDLSEFDTSIDLENVSKIHIGFGDRYAPATGGKGIVYIDDIYLYPARCAVAHRQPELDLNDDCSVDYDDIAVVAADWLLSDALETGRLMLRWEFEDDDSNPIADDTSGQGHHGHINGAEFKEEEPDPPQGYLWMRFSAGDSVNDVDANDYMDGLHGMTVCLWIYSYEVETDNGFIVFDSNALLFPNGGDRRNMRYDAESSQSGRNNVIVCGVNTTGGSQDVDSSSNIQVEEEWQHVAMTWTSGEDIKLYINGALDTHMFTNDSPAVGTTINYNGVTVGRGKEDNGATEGWEGGIDDVQIYNYALSQAQIQTVMGGGTIAPTATQLYYPVPSVAEVYSGESQGSRLINFRDYAVLAASSDWLEGTQLWP